MYGLEFELLNEKAMHVTVVKYLSGHPQMVSGLIGNTRKTTIPMYSVGFLNAD
jgi:hypothetical protein